MPVRKGQHIGGVRTLKDIRDRCYIDPDTGCWHWRLHLGRQGTEPRICVPIGGRVGRDHNGRRAVLLLSGVALGPSDKVWRNRRKCFSTDCVRREHIMYGPRSKMLAHLSEFGEWPIRPGFKAVQAAIARVAKIDRETAYEIRHSPLSTKELSAMHNLSKAQIRNIKRGLSWAPLGASVFSVGAIPPRPTIGGARKDL